METHKPSLEDKKKYEALGIIDKFRELWPYVLGIVVVTNTITGIVASISENSKQIEYNDGASKRRIKNSIEKLQSEWTIARLKKELKDCKDER